jgi:hypothetical protein
VSNTPHNLSVTGPGPVRAVSESQICVFCHTPHAAENIPGAPLWNRTLSGETYTPYTSNSINADDIAATPGGSSKLCLSCHDGTLALGAVNVANGAANVSIPLTGTAADGSMPVGAGAQTGFTRDLGVDLTNDHPISFTYDSTLALADGELRDPATEAHIGDRGPGVKPLVPLESGNLECSSCHDAHIRDDALAHSIKFLRLNRLQTAPPAGGSFSASADTMCLACHDKLGITWAQSAHADVSVADEIYRNDAASLRDLPNDVRVWEAACLNCHDTHTVHGARRLLREGTNAVGVPKSGGEPAIEQACYQCHSSPAESILVDVTRVPNIKTDFLLPVRMPITTSDQAASTEVHDPVNADGIEPLALLGKFQRQWAIAVGYPRARARAHQHRLRRAARHLGRRARVRLHQLSDPSRQLHPQAGRWRNRRRHRRAQSLHHSGVPDLPQVPLGLRLRRQQRPARWQPPGSGQLRRWHLAGRQRADPVHQSGARVSGAAHPPRRGHRFRHRRRARIRYE